MDDTPTLGELLSPDERRRDAIHVAIAPVTAGEYLSPGEHIGFVGDDLEAVGNCENPIGIVDPFLKGDLQKGDRFWMLLYPNTVTGMRHYWKHPAFQRTFNG